MSINQNEAPLWEALLRHCRKGRARFHVPGHRQGAAAPREMVRFTGEAFFELDLTELPGLDDLNSPQGVIEESQRLAADLYEAQSTFFLVNGTTAGLQALLLSSCAPGEPVILPRNSHRSVLGGLILSGADPVFLRPNLVTEFDFAAGASCLELQSILDGCPGARAVLALHPSYYGVVGDLQGQVLVAHELDKPVLVDEAHGVHLPFHEDMPRGALACGADASVQSTHKLGGSLTQTSWLHLKGVLLDERRVAAALRTIQTSSPSYILMASLDLARNQLARQGREMLERVLELAEALRKDLVLIPGLSILNKEHLVDAGLMDLDLTRLVISVREWGLTGFEVQHLLASRYRVYIEMADYTNLVVPITLGTKAVDCQSLIYALRDISVRESKDGKKLRKNPLISPWGVKRMTPREAWYSGASTVPLADAVGKICAEWIAVYPPGVPVLYPGEEITPELREYLTQVKRLGLPVQGPSDPRLETLLVLND